MARRPIIVPGAPEHRHTRDALISEHLEFARRVARRMARRLPTYLDFDDLVASANLGLIDAAARFDPSQGVGFHVFAEPRIRGAILDSVRSSDTMSREMRRINKYLREKSTELTQQLGHFPDHQELASGLGVSLAVLDKMKVRAQAGDHVISLEEAMYHDGQGNGPSFMEVTPDPKAVNAEEELVRHEIADDLTDAVRELPQQMQTVLSLYYAHDLLFKDIAAIMGFTESRACQIAAGGIALLRDMYRKHPGEA